MKTENIVKKVKLAIWVVIIAFVVILIYQNREWFFSAQSLMLDLLFAQYQSPEIKIVFLSFMFFVAGLLLGAYFILVYHLKIKKKVKALNAQVKSQGDQITTFENELKQFRPEPEPEPEPEPAPAEETVSEPEDDAKTVVISPKAQAPAEEQQP
jgi:uncharacterized integral membrane protein